jgi:hypothetical protein
VKLPSLNSRFEPNTQSRDPFGVPEVMQIVEPKSTRQCASDCHEHRQRRPCETAAEDGRSDAACEDPPIYSSKIAGQPIVLSFAISIPTRRIRRPMLSTPLSNLRKSVGQPFTRAASPSATLPLPFE